MMIISHETIKPSSETPHHLKNHKLSALDIRQPLTYIPVIFFYEANGLNGWSSSTTDDHHRAEISKKLKQSLSDTLTTFYPLAWKLDGESLTVNCNDSGVMYVEARTHARLSETVQDPTTAKLKLCLPISPLNADDDILLAVQINFFDCGGLAIGLCLCHLIGDGLSVVMFMNSWAAKCRGEVDPIKTPPRINFDLADYMPKKEGNGRTNMGASFFVPEEILVSKRFVFDKEKLAALREAHATSFSKSSSNATAVVRDPTRVELVSAFIWKYFAQAAISKKLTMSTMAIHGVNLRKRVTPPPYLENTFGNCITIAVAVFNHDRGYPEIHDLVPELRNVIRGVNEESIREMQCQDEESSQKRFKELLLNGGGMEFCTFSSWCRFPSYEVDYGWGKPIWVGTPGFPVLNSTILMDTPSGDGIEVLVNTLPHHIEMLETYVHQLMSGTAARVDIYNADLSVVYGCHLLELPCLNSLSKTSPMLCKTSPM